ncbi:MAG: GDSL-type esterase/lipase family protein [Anaeromyxobacter sp.]
MIRAHCPLALLLVLTACGAGGSGGTTDPVEPPVIPPWLDTGPRILPLGDSITEGWPSTRGGFREALYDRFLERDQAVDFVGTLDLHSDGLADRQHEGHAGWTCADLEGGAPEWLALTDPDAVLLLCGTNDLWHAGTGRSIATAVEALVARVRAEAPEAHVLVGTIPPIRYDFPAFDDTVRAANTLLRAEIPALEDDHVHLVDLAARLSLRDVAGDLIHLDPRGHGNQAVADAWLAGLDGIPGLLAPPATIAAR